MVLAFLQNLWVKDPARVQRMIDQGDEDYRLRLQKRLLFAGGLTGRRIEAAFPEPLRDQIIWEECTREIAGDSRRICPPDPDHIRAALERHRPRVVITFGAVARDAVSPLWDGPLIHAPHPAARHRDIYEALGEASILLHQALEYGARPTCRTNGRISGGRMCPWSMYGHPSECGRAKGECQHQGEPK